MTPSAIPIIRPLIRRAIQERRLIRLLYKGKERIVEPHDYGIQSGVAKLLAYQISDGSASSRPGWRSFHEDSISEVQILDRTFRGGRGASSKSHQQWDILFARVQPSDEDS